MTKYPGTPGYYKKSLISLDWLSGRVTSVGVCMLMMITGIYTLTYVSRSTGRN